ncbi:hypothetical protein LTR78_000111 [Recurvomyces mirabilis]|uniref:NAD(P)-binding protein n=1 Tax=Recurvomyces mirabilis TaxID=574656 RepID=A0AAE0WXY4_9PEZI|nr:hypothetical protein LTR78_000111 [Recurvomyces mirabilis]KAK5161768.1 hypothetical protein LTS14_000113 [Recurvomyces mirabilis]
MSIFSSSTPFDLSLGLEGTHVLITGGCGLIGRAVTQAFLSAGCNVSVVDLADKDNVLDHHDPRLFFFSGSITKDIDTAWRAAETRFGQSVECCIALASLDLSVLPQAESICDMDPATWQRVFDVNINGTFLTCQRWLKGIRDCSREPKIAEKRRNVSCIIMGSEAGRFGVRTMAAYAAGKSAVQQGLLLSLAKDAPRIWPSARVNAVAPGAVDTERFRDECRQFGENFRHEESEATVPLAKAVPVEDVARTILFLASERFSGSVTGQCIAVDGGKMGSVVWSQKEAEERREVSVR